MCNRKICFFMRFALLQAEKETICARMLQRNH